MTVSIVEIVIGAIVVGVIGRIWFVMSSREPLD
jgi:hypothetical protein